MKRIFAAILAVFMVFTLAACGNTGQGSSEASSETESGTSQLEKISKEDLKVGFLYMGKIDDRGYNEAHDQGRIMYNDMGIKTAYRENILTEEACTQAVRELIDQEGCNVIYSTSTSIAAPVEKIAKEYPKVYFEQCATNQTDTNLSSYFGRLYEVRYLSGIAAAKKTDTNHLGYVAAFPNAEIIRSINAFTLGARSVNPDVKVEVIYTNTWADADKERQAATTLIDRGADVLTQSQDTTTTQIVAQERGVFSIGQNYTAYDVAPDAYLTGVLFDWKEYYGKDIEKIMDGTWTPSFYWGSLKDGVVKMDTFASFSGFGTREAVEQAESKLISGEIQPFTGPLKDQSGTVRVADGVKMTDDQIWNMDWLLEGVIVL